MDRDILYRQKIANNLKILRLQRNFTQEKVADWLKLNSTQQYNNYEIGNRNIPIEILSELSLLYNISLDVIVKGDLSKVDLNGLMSIGENRLLFPVFLKEETKSETIEIVSIKASAGYLTGYADPVFVEELPRLSFPFLGEGTYRGFGITGDSMPPIQSGSTIIGKFVEHPSYIKDGRTYILVTKDGITYKRVYRKKDNKKSLTLSSDNKSYADFNLPLENLIEIWEFACSISTKEYDVNEFSLESLFPLVNGISNNIITLSKEMENIKRTLRGNY